MPAQPSFEDRDQNCQSLSTLSLVMLRTDPEGFKPNGNPESLIKAQTCGVFVAKRVLARLAKK